MRTEPPPPHVALFCAVRNLPSFAERLAGAEVELLLNEFFERTCAPVLAHGGRQLRFIGDGLVCVFPADAIGPTPARRALAAALAVALAYQDLRTWVAAHFSARGLPPFALGIGLAGEDDTAVGLEQASRELGWTVVASSAVLQAAGAGVRTGAMSSLQVAEGFVDAAEIVGLESGPQDSAPGMAVLVERAGDIHEALQANSELTARVVKGSLHSTLAALRSHRFEPGGEALRLKGYRLVRPLAPGRAAQVFLAVRESDGRPVVLKVLAAGSEQLARFVQECAVLSRIADRHVRRIYDQGFIDDIAYLAMEYFECGDLRGELAAGIAPARALDVVAQVARALQVIHAQGIVHRDLKPENLMVRADGSVALADFGAAKSLLREDQPQLAHTRHGEVVGTPYYLSPEQAMGQGVTPAADLYSLGVLLYELLAGERPYNADSLHQLLQQHLVAPLPRLPQQHAALQPVLDRLMAKRPDDRYADAGAFLADLRRQQG